MSRRRKNALLERIEYAAYRLVASAVRRASEERVARWGTALGALAGKVLRGRDRVGMRNLRLAFPDAPQGQLRATLDACWRHFGRDILSFVRAQSMSLDEIEQRCQFVGVEILKDAQARGKGVLMLTAHYGSWEIGGLAFMALVGSTLTVARPLDNRFLERDVAAMREKTGAQVVDRRRAARALLTTLIQGGTVILLPDQAVQPREGILAPFLGRPAWTTDAPAKIALRSSSTIVFAFCIPDGTKHRMEFTQAIRTDELREEERDPAVLTARINDILSRRIASRPELWLWMHDRWKGTGS